MKRIIQLAISSLLALSLVYTPVSSQPISKPPTEGGMAVPAFTMVKSLPQTTIEPIQELQPAVVAPTPVLTPAPSTSPVNGCGDNSYANYIYSRESGCKLINPNGSGCDGIGQACPSSKIWAACPNMDYACQNDWFTGYAQKYGGWAGAYDFWVANQWW